METIFYYFQHYYYSNLVLYLVTGVALFLSYKFKYKVPHFPYFFIFPLFSILQQTVSILYPLCSPEYMDIAIVINNSIINFFIGFETIFLVLFFSLYFKRHKTLCRILYLQIFIFLPILFSAELINNYSYKNKYIYSFGSIILIISSLRYFYYILHNPTITEILKRPVFWISCGTLLTYGCLTPITIVLEEISADKNSHFDSRIYSITYILYTLLFLLISKAYLCPKIDKL